MQNQLKIVLAQLNLCVGDIAGNLQKHIQAANKARDELQADIIIFPELSLTGYPPEDLLLRQSFITKSQAALETLRNEIKNIYCLVGHPEKSSNGLYNSCSLIYNGNILIQHHKISLPNYGVFDEKRYFIAGNSPTVVTINDITIGIMICEDLWNDNSVNPYLQHNIQLLLTPNASPFEIDKDSQRKILLAERAKKLSAPIVYVNCIGAQDEIVFDGCSLAMNSDGEIAAQGTLCKEELILVNFDATTKQLTSTQKDFKNPSLEEKIYACLVLGVKDYFQKNNFRGALLGVSGGIDSALTLAIAVDALGCDNVHAIIMPSRYTSEISLIDANELTTNLHVKADTISIEPTFSSFLETLAPLFKNSKHDLTEENIQARCRGIILMAISNKTQRIVLNTSNRSEMAVGYSTLYGDMVGGYAVLKDIPKMLVYELSRYRNSIKPVIPERIISRAPSAELAHDQKDEDSLAPYPTLDKIIELYINQEKSIEEIIAAGFDSQLVKKIIRLININEYKRRQAPIGTRINNYAFGKDRRYPITSKFNL